ncbi:MAG: hypothetical protein KAQ94_06940 [Arcobacteraceae bacterium]|nr:hypothetical protein [Arcobacteraceae bacterium]
MKLAYTLFLIICLILSLFINQYFEQKTSQLKQKVRIMQKDYKEINNISNINKWLKKNILPKINSLDYKEDAQNSLLTFHTQNEKKLNLKIENIDEKNKGYIVINTTSTIFRDDTQKLLELFKLKIQHGFINMKQFKVTNNAIVVNLQFIKAYRNK